MLQMELKHALGIAPSSVRSRAGTRLARSGTVARQSLSRLGALAAANPEIVERVGPAAGGKGGI